MEMIRIAPFMQFLSFNPADPPRQVVCCRDRYIFCHRFLVERSVGKRLNLRLSAIGQFIGVLCGCCRLRTAPDRVIVSSHFRQWPVGDCV